MGNKKVKYNKGRIIFLAAAIALLILILMSVKSVIALIHQNNQLKQENQKLEKDKKALTEEMKVVKDPAYIEEQAKLQLNLVRPGETIYILDKSKSKNEEKKD